MRAQDRRRNLVRQTLWSGLVVVLVSIDPVKAFPSLKPCYLSAYTNDGRQATIRYSRMPGIFEGEEILSMETLEPSSDLESPSPSSLRKSPGSFVSLLQEDETFEDQALAVPGGANPVDSIELFQENDQDARSKTIMFGLLWITACLSALDRVAMSVALVPMSAEFGYTDTIKGSISSLLSVGYGLFIIPAGLLVGGLSPRLVMMSGIALWSMATLATPHAAGWVAGMAPLLLARACVGAGESIVLPTTQRLLSVWASPQEKSRGRYLQSESSVRDGSMCVASPLPRIFHSTCFRL